MEINGQTKLADILAEYPFTKTGMVEINGKFKMLQTPMGKMMAKKATVADMSERSGMPVDELAAAIAVKVGAAQSSPDGSDPADGAYRTIKEQEAKGKPRSEIVGMLMERFGEQNPDVGVQ